MSAAPLRLQRCWNHETREAVARCTGCARSFCRECIAESEGRLLCAGCLRQTVAARHAGSQRFESLRRAAGLVFGFLLGWWILYGFGQLLLLIPASFHDGGAWLGR